MQSNCFDPNFMLQILKVIFFVIKLKFLLKNFLKKNFQECIVFFKKCISWIFQFSQPISFNILYYLIEEMFNMAYSIFTRVMVFI